MKNRIHLSSYFEKKKYSFAHQEELKTITVTLSPTSAQITCSSKALHLP